MEQKMSLRYDVVKDGNLVCAVVNNTISGEDIIELFSSLSNDSAVRRSYSTLLDCSRLSKINIIKDDLNRIIGVLSSDSKNTIGRKIAIVARPVISAEIRGLFEEISENQKSANLIFFNDINTARIWLGMV